MRTIIISALMLINTIASTAQTIIYVDSAATGLNDGSNWINAYTDLQDALEEVQPGGQIWVAKGTYYPTKDIVGNLPSSSTRVFKMRDSVNIYGGFNGTETHPSQRDLKMNRTILSGKNPVVIGAANSSPVVIFFELTTSVHMDGFWVKDGGFGDAAIEIRKSDPWLSNMIVSESMYGIEIVFSSPWIINSIVRDNYAFAAGGGIIIRGHPDPNVLVWSKPVIANCLVVNNHSSGFCAGVYVVKGLCEPVLINTTIAHNTTSNSINHQIRSNAPNVHTKIYNCIISGEVGSVDGAQNTFYNSLIPNSGGSSAWDANFGNDGGGNLDSWPYFKDSANGDYTLQHCSPAIGAGQYTYLPQDKLDLDYDNDTTELMHFDFNYSTRNIGTMAMGAYELATDTLTTKLCLGSNIKIGDSTITSHGVHTIYIPKAGACDSMIVVKVENEVNTTIAADPDSLSFYAVDSNATYQWYDCVNKYALPKDTNQRFTPWFTGTYQVIVSKNGCTDTSSCIAVNKVGLPEMDTRLAVNIYPNPSSGMYNIQFAQQVKKTEIQVADLSGKIVFEQSYSNIDKLEIDLSHTKAGVYLLQLTGDGHPATVRLVKH